MLFRSGFSPPFPLCVTHALPGGGTPLPPFAFWSFRRGGGRRGRACQHLAEFGNLSVDTKLLLFKTFDGGVDDFGCEFVGIGISMSLFTRYGLADIGLLPRPGNLWVTDGLSAGNE